MESSFETLREIVERLTRQGIAYMVVGSVAALVHGRARSTQDVDIVIEASPGQLRRFISELPRERFYASEEAALQAIRDGTLFNVLDIETGWKVDLIPCKSRQFSEAEFSRRRPVDVLDTQILVASVEDVVLSKLEWAKMGGSERQVEDARELVALHGDRFNHEWIDRWADDLGVRELWNRIRGK